MTRGELDEAVSDAMGKIDPSGSGAAQEAADVVTHGVHFTNVHRIRDTPDTIESLRAEIDAVFRQATNGISVTDDKITLQAADSEQKTFALIELTNDRIVEAVENINESVYSATEILKNQIIAVVDDDARKAQAGISIRADEITLQVEDKERELRSTIDMTTGEILAQVDDMKQELTGLIDIQAGAVTALVEGGGASGQMSLSLELPVMINASTRAKFVQASTEEETAAVYAKLDGTDYYAIKGNASNAAVKTLWEKATKASLIASQIVLSADQVSIAGATVFTSSKTTGEINEAKSAAADDATKKADAAQKAAEQTAESQRNEMARQLGYAGYADMMAKAQAGQTIIDGGYLRTALIEVEALLAQNIIMKSGGSLQSANYSAGNAGWKIASDGSVEFAGGKFRGEVNATAGNFTNVTVDEKSVIKGFLQSSNVLTKTVAGGVFH